MAKPLVIVESPAKAKTIAGYLGSDYTVKASVGHIRDLPRSKEEVPDALKETHGRLAGIDPDDHFDACYVVPANKKKVVAELKAALKGADELILATDEDREGEAIGWHVLEVLAPRVPVRRMVFHEITPNAIREALASPRDLDMKLVEAQEGRRKLDRLVGWETSPVLWRVFGRGQAASAGRVQSVAVRMVVERERARMRFRSGQWSDLEGTFVAEEQPFRASLVELDEKRLAEGRDFDPATGAIAAARANDVVLLDAERAAGLAERLRDVAYRVTSTESDPFTEKPRAPFTTSTLQQESGRKLRYTAARTMAVAQRLYERGFITYMRTDSTNLSEQAIGAARTAIRERYGEEYLPAEPRTYRNKVKNAQEAHEAIRPAGDRIRTPDAVNAELDADERRLYELIWIRTVACQMADARGRKMTIRLGATSTQGERATFRAVGQGVRLPRLAPRVHRRRRRGRRGRGGSAYCPRSSKARRSSCTRARVRRSRDQAARALHRGEPREGARGARHRPPVDVRGGDRDDPGARVRVAQGHRARSRVDRVRGDEPARAALRPSRRLLVHRDDGRGARRHRARRG